MTRLGLIGLGTWAKRYVTTIEGRSDCEIVAFAVASESRPETVRGATRCKTWRDVLDLAKQGRLDAVIAATTPTNHAEIGVMAASEGVPVLVEKPLGESRHDAVRVLLAFQRSAHKAPIVVDYVHLFAPAYRRLKELVATSSGGCGSITRIESQGSNHGPFRSWSPLIDYGPHDVALCLDVLGTTTEIRLMHAKRVPSSAGGALYEARFEADGASILMRFGNGAHAKMRRFTVTLKDERTMVYDDCEQHPNKLIDAGTAVPIDETPPLDVALTYFLGQQRLWAAMGPDAGDGARWLELSIRIAEILDMVALAAGDAA